jgi:hypothetical protein
MENIKDLTKKLPSLLALVTLSAGIVAIAIGKVKFPAMPTHMTLVSLSVVIASVIVGLGIGVWLSKDGEVNNVHFVIDFLGAELLAVALAMNGTFMHKPFWAFVFTITFVTISLGAILRSLITSK